MNKKYFFKKTVNNLPGESHTVLGYHIYPLMMLTSERCLQNIQKTKQNNKMYPRFIPTGLFFII